MNARTMNTLVLCASLLGCRQARQPVVEALPPPPPEAAAGKGPGPGPRKADPLDQRIELALDGATLPEVISKLSHDVPVAVSVSATIPVSEWSQHRVALRANGVTLRAFLDWLVRPLRAQYALDGSGGVWLSRSDDLLDDEPLELRSYRVPTHLTSTRPVRGALVFEREQAWVVETLHACLQYIEERRKGCRLAFHESQDVLVARLPGCGHTTLDSLLYAMRHGSALLALPSPSAVELRERLDATVAWDQPPGPASHLLFRIAEAARVNLGWDPAPLAASMLAIPKGTYTLRQLLDAAVRQTPLGRYDLEPGHGIWLYREGQDANLPASGATPWGRAIVQAYGVRPVLAHLSAEELLAQVRKGVDSTEWTRGLPAAAVFPPTGRLIVVHDEAGQRRVAAVVHDLVERYRRAPAQPGKGPVPPR